MTGAYGHDWMPIGVDWRDGAPEVDWCFAAGERLAEPFFDDSVRRLVARPFNKVFRHRMDAASLEAWPAGHTGLMPSGFIFHMSRCGSTLVTQMLAARGDCIVLAEPMAIGSMLQPPVPIPEDRHAAWLRALILAMGQPRFGEQHYVIKFDCWHILNLPLIARAFPDVPLVFLYREPREVLASHLRRRGYQTVPAMLDPNLFGIGMSDAVTMSPPEYCARILGRILAAAPRHGMVHYRELPEAVFETVLPKFGMPITATSRAAMEAASGRYSKRPAEPYARADDARGIAPESPADVAASVFMDPPYRALESLRRRLPDVVTRFRPHEERRIAGTSPV